jgi:hypothetical protein
MNPTITIGKIEPISKEAFYEKYVSANRPVVISNLVNDWEALQTWTPEYFANRFSYVNAGVVPLRNGELDLSEERGSKIVNITVEESIKSVQAGKLTDGWAIASPIENFPLEMQQQCPPSVYCASGKFLRGRVFIGPKGIVTSLHQDLFENLYTTVNGCKRITLFAPNSPVYRHSPFSKLPNHAQVNPENPDYNRFPKFKNTNPIIIDLKAGETLYIPAFWWHHLRNTEPTIAVSYWWSQGWRLPIAWAAAVYKKCRGI